MRKLFKINELDNVYVLREPVVKGEQLDMLGLKVTIPYDLGRGHKIAVRDIPLGEKVIKFGLPIGSSTQAIRAGEHVHLHNLKSDYLPTYSKDDRFKS